MAGALALGFEAGPLEFEAGPLEFDAGPLEFEAGPLEFEAGPLEFEAGPSDFEARPALQNALAYGKTKTALVCVSALPSLLYGACGKLASHSRLVLRSKSHGLNGYGVSSLASQPVVAVSLRGAAVGSLELLMVLKLGVCLVPLLASMKSTLLHSRL